MRVTMRSLVKGGHAYGCGHPALLGSGLSRLIHSQTCIKNPEQITEVLRRLYESNRIKYDDESLVNAQIQAEAAAMFASFYYTEDKAINLIDSGETIIRHRCPGVHQRLYTVTNHGGIYRSLTKALEVAGFDMNLLS